ncbi:MAG: hypothetical protein M3P85_02120 [Actinomycetota bacterium]|nr:hypothetical protein [Actinomycetota bacterium]
MMLEGYGKLVFTPAPGSRCGGTALEMAVDSELFDPATDPDRQARSGIAGDHRSPP